MKVLSTDGLTKLIQLIKSSFISNTDTEETTEIELQETSEVTLATVATTGAYSDLTGTPNLATVATSGSYTDLSDKPTIPTVNNATLTITQGGTTKGTFTANASSNATIDLDAGNTYTAGEGISIDQNDEISVDAENIGTEVNTEVTTEKDSESVTEVTVAQLLESITGYNASATQTLKNVNGTFQWVTD